MLKTCDIPKQFTIEQEEFLLSLPEIGGIVIAIITQPFSENNNSDKFLTEEEFFQQAQLVEEYILANPQKSFSLIGGFDNINVAPYFNGKPRSFYIRDNLGNLYPIIASNISQLNLRIEELGSSLNGRDITYLIPRI